ncbi:MAG: hypothetical protein A2626_02230 [Candidatus Nealsonbacteria bacterium RIFCSPHIGHO2_01_FULL_38_55]|uniref:HEPN AbiU2-like domain-containing protein n=1 Tax=Candidatus Nealsonbacteria bacterium RIFCSPHIGHO2_01_FULL_38_55 TaxID=1801664 RepID=A0A1G2E0I0_9BACT|nr:MAG: hypothetical protein A2626_02230 [Candidatus Nealsonbacteria bacterium RIFCSPHIGHO2_01_FULL_38_55]
MNGPKKDYEYEIINQILLAELCFDICKLVPIIDGLGSHFFLYFYNLNYSTGIIALNNLLLSKNQNEISLLNFLDKYEKQFDQKEKPEVVNFRRQIEELSQKLKNILPFNLRNKVAAHRDEKFRHYDFCCAYLLPNYLKEYSSLNISLKRIFCNFSNFCFSEFPNGRIVEQVKEILPILDK